MQIRPRYLLLYTILEGWSRRLSIQQTWNLNETNRKKAYGGLIGNCSAKRLRRCIENLVAISLPKQAVHFTTGKKFKFKVNFITLTLPCPQGEHSDKEVKRQCLDVWIKAAKRTFGLKSYVWRAERQLNGNIHFHIISDCYMHYEILRDSWNKRLNNLGYIDTFEKKHGHRTPNSTDVHAVNNIKDLAAYMVKYMTKGNNTAESLRAQPPWTKPKNKIKFKKNGPKFQRVLSLNEQRINGRVWDASTNLKTKDKCDFIIDSETAQLIDDAINKHECRHKVNDRVSMIFLKPGQLNKVLTTRYRNAWEEYLQKMRN